MKHSFAWLAALVILVSGCGPEVRSASFAKFSPRPEPQPIQLFSTKLPECPYEEVGLVRVDKGLGWNSLEDMLESLRDRAREMGGDAVVGLGQTQQVEGGVVLGDLITVGTTDGLAGTVIRFTDETCRR